MKDVVRLARAAAQSDAPVLIQGETGVGKDIVARLVHHASDRAGGPFVRTNCAALPAAMVEAELFGHEKGSFTGATARRKGLFELASGGTLFLDEVSAMPFDAQAKLLHVAERSEYRRVGGVDPLCCSARIISAANTDLEAAAQQGLFRPDLYYRLSALAVRVPPLRERREDVRPLLRMFFASEGGTTSTIAGQAATVAATLLAGYRWPGNVRQLRNYARTVALAVRTQGISWGRAVVSAASELVPSGMGDLSLQRKRHAHMLAVLERVRWNLSRAARLLGIHRNTLAAQLARTKPRAENCGDVLPLRLVEDAHVRRVLGLCDGNAALAARVLGVSRAFVRARSKELTQA